MPDVKKLYTQEDEAKFWGVGADHPPRHTPRVNADVRHGCSDDRRRQLCCVRARDIAWKCKCERTNQAPQAEASEANETRIEDLERLLEAKDAAFDDLESGMSENTRN